MKKTITSERKRKYNRDCQRKYRLLHIDKIRARKAVFMEVRSGRMMAKVCEGCGHDVYTQAHHDSYLRPLEVRWLCRTCHWDFHKSNRYDARTKSYTPNK